MVMTNKKKLLLLSATSLWVTLADASEITTNAALMQAMDKVTGRVNKITVPVNSKISYGDFSLVLRSCKKRPAEEFPENFAFVDVTDKSFGADEYNIFRGWLLSSTPGINAIEHPIYDVWLLECIDTEVDEKQLLSAEDLRIRDNLPVREDLIVKPEIKTDTQKNEENTESTPKVIRIKEFIQEDRDIEKDIRNLPAYISETSGDMSDIEEGDEPENLLMFTKMQEVPQDKKTQGSELASPEEEQNELSKAIEAEINSLNQN